jgi:intraflagellar transport protein 140
VPQVAWAGQHTLAMASGKELLIRLFNFDTEDNYILPLAGSAQSSAAAAAADSAQAPCCLEHDARHDELAVGLRDGRVMMFRRRLREPEAQVLDLSKTWEAQPAFQVGANGRSCICAGSCCAAHLLCFLAW